MDRQIAILHHSDPEWIVLNEPERKSLPEALLRGIAQNPLIPKKSLERLLINRDGF
jgi:hypothetical protein